MIKRMYGYVLCLCAAFIVSIPCFAGQVQGDSFSAYISTTVGSIYGYPCFIDGFYIYNSSNAAQTIILYDNATEVFRCQAAASTDKEVVAFRKKISSSIKATASDTTGNNKVKLHVNVN